MPKIVELTEEQKIERHYNAMIDSVALIISVIGGVEMIHDSDEDKRDTVKRNVLHLEIMLEEEFWTTEDMTAVTAAIDAGNTYINS